MAQGVTYEEMDSFFGSSSWVFFVAFSFSNILTNRDHIVTNGQMCVEASQRVESWSFVTLKDEPADVKYQTIM